MRVSLISLNQAWEDKDKNKEYSRYFISKAKKDKAELIIFPEMTLTGFSMNTQKISENFKKSETIMFFAQCAKEFNISIIFGIVVRYKDKALNQAILVNAEGKTSAIYSKIHPFSYANETKYFYSGEKLAYFKQNEYNFALTICYDLRFPELYQALSKNAEVVINIANWPSKRIDHWMTLLKARAIENQIYMIGVNRTGIDGNKHHYNKCSKIFGPDGNKILPIITSKKYDLYDINPSCVHDSRKIFPVKNDRKIKFYKKIL